MLRLDDLVAERVEAMETPSSASSCSNSSPMMCRIAMWLVHSVRPFTGIFFSLHFRNRSQIVFAGLCPFVCPFVVQKSGISRGEGRRIEPLPSMKSVKMPDF